jgi:hypothetical protein
MATQGYDPNKAATFNQLRQQGLSEEAAAAQAGILVGDQNYEITNTYNSDGTKNPNPGAMGPQITGAKVAGVNYDRPTAQEQAESDRYFTQVPYQVKANSTPSKLTPINYVTTSTENVSGGGSTATIAGPKTATAESQTYAAEAAAKQREINQFYRDNPGNFDRKRAGLPPLTPEENEARLAKLGTLQNQYNTITDKQAASETPGTPTIITTPNTTTTTQTVTSGTTAVNNPVAAPSGPDPVVNQQTGIQLGTTLNPIRATATSPLPADGDEVLAAEQAEQELIDLRIAAGSSTPVDIQTDGLLEQQQAILQAQEVADLRVAAESATPVDSVTEGLLLEQEQLRQFQADEALNARLDRAAELDLANSGDAALEAADRAREAADLQTAALTYSPAPVSTVTALDSNEFGTPNVVQNQDDVNANAAVVRGLTNNTQNQSTLQTRQNTPAAADWRVRLRLAPNANYLYKDKAPGILAPLAATDGVIFPYTPAIETSYQAKYANYDLTHSNYRGYFYQNSSVENISIKGTFTAQDTREAAYLLAVIHFFKSVTKMFYGQDEQAGTPPPLVYLSGFGKYQFNESPCVVTTFGYSLPTDVDYIRANGFNNIGLNMENRRNQSSGPAIGGSLGTVVAIIDRLTNAGLNNGSLSNRPSPSQVNQNVTNQTAINSTYVPTKVEISITLLPMQTRNQVSKQFSLKSFANGSLLAGGGFW